MFTLTAQIYLLKYNKYYLVRFNIVSYFILTLFFTTNINNVDTYPISTAGGRS